MDLFLHLQISNKKVVLHLVDNHSLQKLETYLIINATNDLKGDYWMKWRTADWVWVILFAVFVQGLIYVNMYHGTASGILMDVISYVSTFVSIALAGVAIYISIREATNGDKVKDEINLALGEMRSKLNTLDSKFDKIDPSSFNQHKDATINDNMNAFMDDIKAILRENGEKNSSEVTELISSKVEEVGNNLKSSIYIKEENADASNGYDSLAYRVYITTIENHLKNLTVGEVFTKNALIELIQKFTFFVEDKHIERYLLSSILEGKIERIGNNLYKKVK